MTDSVEIGVEYKVKCPFVRDTYTEFDEDGPHQTLTWRPGVTWELVMPDDSEPVANGEGYVLYYVVDIHKLPKPYPARVFYTRKWIDPAGKKFGKNALHITTLQAFKRKLEVYRYGGFDPYYPYTIKQLEEEDLQSLLKDAA